MPPHVWEIRSAFSKSSEHCDSKREDGKVLAVIRSGFGRQWGGEKRVKIKRAAGETGEY